MATKEQPFTNPVLEVGVPQYPTPSVPDFYNKTGHVVLLEKISTKKGNYEPLPLDGSVVYSGKDAGKWPDPLYLVFQQVSKDGEFAYRFWANDRSYASQDPWNYNIQYSEDNPNYPVYTRTYVIRREQYEPFDIGTVDPIFGGTAVVTKQEMKELPDEDPMHSLHVMVNVVYESVPGPTLGGAQNKGGLLGLVSTSTQIVDPATTPDSLSAPNATLKGVVESSVEPVSSTKSKKTTVYSNSPLTLSGDGKKDGLLGTTTTIQSIVAYGATPDSLGYDSISGASTLQSSVEPLDSTKSKKTTIVSSGPTQLIGKLAGEYGFVSTTEEINSYSHPIIPNVNTVKLERSPIDENKSKIVNHSYDSLLAVSGNQYDEYLNKFIQISREVVAAGTTAPTPSSSNMIMSMKDEPQDIWKTVRIQSKLLSLPPDRTEYKTGTHSSPLLVFGMNFQVVDLTCGSTKDLRVLVQPNTRAAQSRLTTFKTITSFSYGPLGTPLDYDIFSPELKNVYYTGIFINFDLGAALCDAIIQTSACYYCGNASIGCENINIPATSISATEYLGYVQASQYKKVSWESEYWRSNIWVSKSVYAKLV